MWNSNYEELSQNFQKVQAIYAQMIKIQKWKIKRDSKKRNVQIKTSLLMKNDPTNVKQFSKNLKLIK